MALSRKLTNRPGACAPVEGGQDDVSGVANSFFVIVIGNIITPPTRKEKDGIAGREVALA